MNWKKQRIGDLITLQRGHDLPSSQRVSGNIPIVSSSGITDFHNKSKYNGEGVVTGRYGTLGKVYYLNEKYWPLNTTLFVKDFKGNVPKFIYYFLKTIHLERFNGAAAVPGLDRNVLHKVEVRFPSNKDTQQKIASILSAYDDLIENNNQRIKLLEEMAEEIYKEWFVRLRFPGYKECKYFDKDGNEVPQGTEGALPEEWEKKQLKDIVTFVNESVVANEKLWSSTKKYLPIDLLPRKSMFLKESEDISNAQSSLIEFKKYDILFGSMRAYFHKVIVAPFEGVTRKTCFVLRAKTKPLFSYSYLTFYQEEVVGYAAANSKGSTIPYSFWEGGLNKFNLNLPSSDVLEKFDELVKPMIDFILDMHEKNQVLQETRDLLLPRLISGKLSVEDINTTTIENNQSFDVAAEPKPDY